MDTNVFLKWNDHSRAFIQNLKKVHLEKWLCDATIVCQGIHFPVHRFVLCTCSGYFEELFSVMQCQHPYIVFRDISSEEMELLLNYVYHGEVYVLKEKLLAFIQGAETLKLKGLAVPDDSLPTMESRKMSYSNSNGSFQSEGRSENSRKQRGSQSYPENDFNSINKQTEVSSTLPVPENGPAARILPLDYCTEDDLEISITVKEEPLDSTEHCEEVNFSSATADEMNMNIQNIVQSINFIDFPAEGSQALENVGSRSSEDRKIEGRTWVDTSEATGTNWSTTNIPLVEARLAEGIVELTTEELLASTQVETRWKGRSGKRAGGKDLPSVERKCPCCDYRNVYLSAIKRHIRFKHTNERPYPCSICEKRFVEKSTRDRHITVHTGVKPYQCPNCSRKYRNPYSLAYHVRNGVCKFAKEQSGDKPE